MIGDKNKLTASDDFQAVVEVLEGDLEDFSGNETWNVNLESSLNPMESESDCG